MMNTERRIERMIEKRPNHRPQKERMIEEPLQKDYFTIYEVAELLGFHHNTVRRMIKSGELKATQFNNREWRIKKTDLEAFTKPSNV